MEKNSVYKLSCLTIAAAAVLLMNACSIAPHQRLESQSVLANRNNVRQIAANEYLNRCGEQTRMLKHEVASCSAVPLVTVPLQ